MSDLATLFDLDALKAIVQGIVGERVPVLWGTNPELLRGPSGLGPTGLPIPGVPPLSSPSTPTPAGGMGGGMSITLDVPVLSPTGVPDTRRTFDSVDQVQILTQVEVCNFTLTIKIESDSYPAAITVAQRLKRQFRRKSTLAALRAMNVALRRLGDAVSISVANWDNRIVDALVLDVFLRYTEVEIDDPGETTPTPGLWIETIGPTGTTDGTVNMPLTLTPPTIATSYVVPDDEE